MRNMIGKRIFDDEIQDHEHYYGHACCGQCMWFDSERPSESGHCEYREWAEKHGRPMNAGHGRPGEEEIWASTEGCLEWFD